VALRWDDIDFSTGKLGGKWFAAQVIRVRARLAR
jgi:hypothetical protein